MEVASETGTICASDKIHRIHQKSSSEQTDTTANHNHRSIVKPLSFSNGLLKHRSDAKNNIATAAAATATALMVAGGITDTNIYKECLKNHAAGLGGYALDGCGEFMPSPNSSLANPASLICAACDCHRSFHRRDPDDPLPLVAQPTSATRVIEYQPHHRHHPPMPSPAPAQAPLRGHSTSPPPISSSYYPSSAPHMLLPLTSVGLQNPPPATKPEASAVIPPGNSQPMKVLGTPNSNSKLQMMTPNGRKRFRTKFSAGQKEKMLDFAGKVGWKMQRRDEEIVTSFCNEIGIEKNVLKVWMHNNKSKSAIEHRQIQIQQLGNGNNGNNGNANQINPIKINTIVQNHMNMNINDNIVVDDDRDDNDDDEDLPSPQNATNGSSSSS